MSANLARSTYLMPVDVEKDEEGKENVRLLYVQNKRENVISQSFQIPENW